MYHITQTFWKVLHSLNEGCVPIQGEEPDEDDAYALMASLKRIYAFYQCHDLNSWNLWDTLFYITRQGMDANGIPEEVKNYACSSHNLEITRRQVSFWCSLVFQCKFALSVTANYRFFS